MFNKGKKVFGDFWDPAIFKDPEFLESIYMFNPNKIEFSEMIGIDPESWNLDTITHEDQAKHHDKFGENTKLVVKMGTEGSFYYDKDRIVKAASFTISNPSILDDHKVIDTVGAGDAFISGFCKTYTGTDFKDQDNDMTTRLIEGCLQFANTCGFLTVCKNGAQSSPSWNEVSDFVKNYVS